MAGGIFVGNIDAVCISWMMVIMVVAAVIWEAFCGYLDRTFSSKAQAEMLSKVYKELMILGFIAFNVIMSKELGLHMSPTMLHCFEFCDLLLSISVLLYVLSVAMAAGAMHVTQREWDRMAMKPVSAVIHDREKKEEARICNGGCAFLTDLGVGIQETDFKLLQLLFKTKFHLHHHFDYVQYIKIILEETTVDMANITQGHWTLICMVCGIWYFFAKAVTGSDMTGSFMDEGELAQATASSGRRRLGGAAENETPPECLQLPTILDHHSAWSLGDCESKSHQVHISEASMYLANISTEYSMYLSGSLNASSASALPLWSNFVGQCESCNEAINAKHDLSGTETRFWIFVFGCVGWLVVLLQTWILFNVRSRMKHVLKLHNATTYKKSHNVLRKLNKVMIQLIMDATTAVDEKTASGMDRLEGEITEDQGYVKHDVDIAKLGANASINVDVAEEDDDTLIDVRGAGVLHYVSLTGKSEEEFDDLHVDHKMKFGDGKGGFVTADKVLSYKACEVLLFITKFFQLMIAMYLGFYMCHMSQRPAKTPDNFLMRILMHLYMAAPIYIVIKMLIPSAVKLLALLVGVLHLNDEAVSQVLVQMETVRSIRKRITDGMAGVAIVDGKPNNKLGQETLDTASQGEVTLLETLCQRPMSDRITRAEFAELIHSAKTLTKKKLVKKFWDRGEFEDFKMGTPQEQRTALTAKTLELADDEENDTITILEACTFLLRKASEAQLLAKHNGVEPSVLDAYQARLNNCVSPANLADSQVLAACRALFKVVDRDNSGKLSRVELQRAFRKFKIPIARAEFGLITRIIDPDQSKTLSMEEWIDFMMASDEDLSVLDVVAASKEGEANAAKGTGVIALAGEATAKMAGDRAASVVTGVLAPVGSVVGAITGGGYTPRSGEEETDITDVSPRDSVRATAGRYGLDLEETEDLDRSSRSEDAIAMVQNPTSDDLESTR